MPEISNHVLTKIFNEIHRIHFRNKFKRIYAEFYPYRTIRHRIEWTRFSIRAKISVRLQNAPIPILQVLAIILLAKVYKQSVSRSVRQTYSEFIKNLPQKDSRINGRSLEHYTPLGRVYNLNEIYQDLNTAYFDNNSNVETIGWSKRKSYTRLGFYDPRRDLLVISKIFDSIQVPKEIVKYLVFHEMLHIKIPSMEIDGRRRIHSAEFKQLEHRYPNYDAIQKWIKKNLKRL
jgi:predicted metal-dependent hydrolase